MLREGDAPEKLAAMRGYLERSGQRNLPVTVDNQDWSFEEPWVKAERAGRTEVLRELSADYLAMMRLAVRGAEETGDRLFGRPVPPRMFLGSGIGWHFARAVRPVSSGRAPAHSRLGYRSRFKQAARSLSAGQKRRLALARLLLAEASLWVLDEPVTNLDTAGIALVEELIQDHVSHGGLALAAAHQRLLDESPNLRRLELG